MTNSILNGYRVPLAGNCADYIGSVTAFLEPAEKQQVKISINPQLKTFTLAAGVGGEAGEISPSPSGHHSCR